MIFAVANQKGGVGKSTTAFALASGLARCGKKVLIIDLDPQCNMSFSAKANAEKLNIYDLLAKQVDVRDVLQQAEKTENLFFIASGPKLAGLEVQLASEMGREQKLKEAIEPVKNMCDYIVIDTPPNLGLLTINALVASDRVIITSTADIFSLQGIAQLYGTIEATRKYCNPDLKIEGILLTKYSHRTILSRELAEQAKDVASKIGTKIFDTVIREWVAIREAQVRQQDIFTYNLKSSASKDYMNFINELLKNME